MLSGWEGLQNLKSLRELTIGRAKIRGLQGITNPRLESLDISESPFIRDRDLVYIEGLNRLEVLDLSNMSKLKSLRHLAPHRRLQTIVLKEHSIEDGELEDFLSRTDEFRRLTKIELSERDPLCQDLRFEHIVQCLGD